MRGPAKGARLIVVTNNPMARVLARGRKVEFCDSDFLGVLKAARDRIHLGHELLTHPLSGSVKPWETPYKTIVLSDAKGALDEKGLSVIEESIQACIRLKPKAAREWSEKTLADFRLIDYNLVFGHTGELQ